MAKQIIGGIGSLLGLKKKKKAAEPAPAAEQKGPIVTKLSGGPDMPPAFKRRLARGFGGSLSSGNSSTSDKLG